VRLLIEEEPLCPECGNSLTGIRVLKDKNGKITIEFFCDERDRKSVG
jgi:hypothetical protein